MNTLAKKAHTYLLFDSDLPSIAAMAAAEVDDLLRDEGSNLKYLGKLSEIIARPLRSDAEQHRAASQLFDPVSANVMTKSIADFHGSPLQSYDDLVLAIHSLTAEIKNVKDRQEELPLSTPFLSQLKEFCLSLSRYSLASKDKIDNFSGSPEYRR